MIARITIVGGGFSGASAAIQLLHRSPVPLAVTIVEPRAELGYGSAYSSDDRDHRLNGNLSVHLVDPQDPDAFFRWCAREQMASRDPEAVAADGSMFVRRREFGRFVAESVEALSKRASVRIAHVRDRASDLIGEDTLTIVTQAGARVPTDLLVVATGNSMPRLPSAFAPALAGHPAIIAAPDDLARIRAIPRHARALVVGTGLTALDVISTMIRAGHEGRITAVSRRGLRPRPHRPVDLEPPKTTLLERIDGPIAPFVRDAGAPPTARKLLRALRHRIREVEAAGARWYVAFDELRDPLWQTWSALDVQEKRRILRHLRPWYDVHRFRAPPQNDAFVREAEAQGRVQFRAARLCSVDVGASGDSFDVELIDRCTTVPRRLTFDAVVNCIGLDFADAMAANPFLAAMKRRGLLVIDPAGIGVFVDDQCRPIGAQGRPHERIRVVGPPTCGTFGDPLGAIFIAAQIQRSVPGMLALVGRRA
ncbi:MAG TPA: FAD/NAD(P)-binding protein [Casimicrobiaceae bacterium]